MGNRGRAEPQITLERIGPTENVDFKELRFLTL